MRRIGLIVALGALLGMLAGAVTASPALAGRGPKWEFLPAEPQTLDASVCGFAVQTVPVSKEFIKVLKATAGSETDLITGSFRESYTNLSTGTTITENGSASAKVTMNADGSGTVVARGRIPIMVSPGVAQQFGLPRVAVLAGLLTYSFDQNGNTTSLSLNGHVLVDVCAALS